MRAIGLLLGLVLAVPASHADVQDAMFHLRRGEPDLAYEQFRKAAEAGDAFAARSLGFLLYSGVEVQGGRTLAAKPEEATAWFRRGAEAGDKVSAEWLGVMLFAGRGTARSAAEALDWFRKAGRDVDAQLKRVETYPETDRAQLAAWPLALAVGMQQEAVKIGRKKWFASGVAQIIVDGHTGKARIGKTDGERLGELALSMVEEALLLAPAPPAAALHRYQMSYDVDFRHR